MSFVRIAAVAAVVLPFATAAGATTTVTALDGSQGWTADNVLAGNSQIVDLTGAGGALENNQPAPIGAVKQTTGSDVHDKSTVSYTADYGTVSQIFNSSLNFAYSYYKSSGSTNVSAAPALKLTFYNPNYSGDGYGQLVYEPYWQPNGSLNNPTPDVWHNASIDLNNGMFWSTAMFGEPNGAGGAPFHTLADWLTTLGSGFQGASLISVGIGVGTYNTDQVDYFDNVTIGGTNGPNGTYDFEPAAPVPVPASLPLLLCAVGGLGLVRRRKKA